ncbi:hypothetical protein [Bacillus smithii]|uniref:hypothetical protein n=1 Tax=Bacillus smithii TaxID=1479 RepID=UPI003D1B793A
MKGVKRKFIDIDWDKIKQLYPNIEDEQIRCMKDKWSPFKNWQQGFDSDCAIHCRLHDICFKAFYDERVEGENHFKEIVIPTEEKLWWGDEQVELIEIK